MKKKILNVIAAAFTAAARRINQHVTDSGIAVLDRTTPMALPGATPMREAGAERIAAVVVGGADNGGGLGLVRSLGLARVPFVAVDRDGAGAAFAFRAPRRDAGAERAVVRRRPVAAWFDAGLVPHDRRGRADRLGAPRRARNCYRIRLPSHDSLVALSRKSAFQELAERNGFAVPRSIYLRAMSDVASLVRLRFPLVIKPSVKTAHYLARQFERCYRVASIAEAQAVCRDVMPVLPDLVAQEWIEGADTALYFCLQYRGAGGAIASFTGRKLSIWPPRHPRRTASCSA
jgi:D-aspartate ligase